MYGTFKADDSLAQGDVCRDIPLPLLTEKAKFSDPKANQIISASVPSRELLATRSNLFVGIPMVRTHALIISQSCDAEDVERRGSGRILVAPLDADDAERFITQYEGATKDAAEALMKKMVASATKGAQAPETSKSSLDGPRRKQLESLWLGNVVGAFPLQANEQAGLMRRSLCYFDNVVSLPPEWVPFLKERRVLRLANEWASVLQEALGQWLGRFAFPGEKDDRLRTGGLVDAPHPPAQTTPEGVAPAAVTEGAPATPSKSQPPEGGQQQGV